MLFKIQIPLFKKIHSKLLYTKYQPFCPYLNMAHNQWYHLTNIWYHLQPYMASPRPPFTKKYIILQVYESPLKTDDRLRLTMGISIPVKCKMVSVLVNRGPGLIMWNYCEISNISHTLVGDKIVYHSDVVGASPVRTAPTTSSFLT